MAAANLPVPEVLRQHAEDEIQNWIRTRFQAMEANGQRELAVRPFCRWLDRNLEPIFTEGKVERWMRKVKMEVEEKCEIVCFTSCPS